MQSNDQFEYLYPGLKRTTDESSGVPMYIIEDNIDSDILSTSLVGLSKEINNAANRVFELEKENRELKEMVRKLQDEVIEAKCYHHCKNHNCNR